MAIYAVVPAAGLSRRMGQPKLLMSSAGSTVIDRVLDALSGPSLKACVVVCRSDDRALQLVLLQHDRIHVLAPNPAPVDMRQSVEAALRWISARYHPAETDAWALVPADSPALTVATVERILAIWQQQDDVDLLIPEQDGRGGHPTLFRWRLAERVFDLPKDKGINALANAADVRVRRIPVNDPAILVDVDTPLDWQRFQKGEFP